ncbi:MAG: molecular chaperone DnaK [Verrucomicrobia bacterium]|nr:molecular chaperone DnaK [Pseudomonadota bacterium]NBS06985.1 molecular chaperone DnaK [Verrucomicrobiota bacterium]NBS79506.1 molecular chaperone DnaK [bacterium]NBS50215.1 molecular chaperone DnaK [Verrucomicrobiota bacterium]NBT23557.1 molecular chaperone DnaK [bacterium]
MAKKSKSKKASKSKPKKKVLRKKSKPRASSKAKKKASSKTVAPKKPSGPPFPIKTPAKFLRPLDENTKPAKPPKFSSAFLERQKLKLAELRDHIVDQMQGVTKDSLRERGEGGGSAFGMHQADAGSDAYEKDFALSLLSQEQDALYEIESALKRIEAHVYGVCEMSGQPIPVARLEAIPFARFTVECQSRFEQENKGKNRWEPAQPLMDSNETSDEEGGDESDEEEKNKSKE